MALIGYCRVSKDKTRQDLRRQRDQLRKAGCDHIIEEHVSGDKDDRPQLENAIVLTAAGDTLVAVSLDRVARGLSNLLQIIQALQDRGAHLRILDNPIDTSSPFGTLLIQIIGAFAEWELKMIRSRTTDGVAAARRRGRVGGNPGIMAGDRAAIEKTAAARREARLRRLIASAEQWMPTVRKMRPDSPWPVVVRSLNAKEPKKAKHWSVRRLQQAVRTLVANHAADQTLLRPAPKPKRNLEVVTLVATIKLANPDRSYREIGQQLTAVHCHPPNSGRERRPWSPSSIRLLVKQARRLGLVPPEAQGAPGA